VTAEEVKQHVAMSSHASGEGTGLRVSERVLLVTGLVGA